MQAVRTLFFFFLFAVLACHVRPSFAAATSTGMPEMLSRIHCTLLLQSLRTVPLSSAILEQKIASILGEHGSAPPNSLAVIAYMKYLPDFGFILGRRWESMAREERMRFNRSFSLHLGDHYDLKDYTGSDCAMNTTLYGNASDPNAAINLPMRAISYTQLTNDNHRITLIYSYNFLPNSGWEIQDIAIQDRSLTAEYRIPLNALIHKGGTAHIERLVQSLTD